MFEFIIEIQATSIFITISAQTKRHETKSKWGDSQMYIGIRRSPSMRSLKRTAGGLVAVRQQFRKICALSRRSFCTTYICTMYTCMYICRVCITYVYVPVFVCCVSCRSCFSPAARKAASSSMCSGGDKLHHKYAVSPLYGQPVRGLQSVPTVATASVPHTFLHASRVC